MIMTEFNAEQEYKKELSEGTINTPSTPYYNNFKEYCQMLRKIGCKIVKELK